LFTTSALPSFLAFLAPHKIWVNISASTICKITAIVAVQRQSQIKIGMKVCGVCLSSQLLLRILIALQMGDRSIDTLKKGKKCVPFRDMLKQPGRSLQ
jgi:hypothetical protein